MGSKSKNSKEARRVPPDPGEATPAASKNDDGKISRAARAGVGAQQKSSDKINSTEASNVADASRGKGKQTYAGALFSSRKSKTTAKMTKNDGNDGDDVEDKDNDTRTENQASDNNENQEKDKNKKDEKEGMPIRIEFLIPKNNPTFNLLDEHLKLFKELKKADPKIIIYSKKTPISDAKNFPKNKKDYEADFEHFYDNYPASSPKITVTHRISTSIRFNDLKNNQGVMEYLNEKNIFLMTNPGEWKKIAKIGWIQYVNTRTSWRPDILEATKEAAFNHINDAELTRMLEGDTKVENIPVAINSRKISFGRGENKITTEAFEVTTPLQFKNVIKESLSTASLFNKFRTGNFIPYGIAKELGERQYGNQLLIQTQFLQEMVIIPIIGITEGAMATEIPTDEGSKTLEEFIEAIEHVTSVERTQKTTDKGKWFIETDKTNAKEVQEILDEKLATIYQSGIIDEDNIMYEFPTPKRINSREISDKINKYTESLKKQNPEDYNDAQRKYKDPYARQKNVVYSHTEFPKLQGQTNGRRENIKRHEQQNEQRNYAEIAKGKTTTSQEVRKSNEQNEKEIKVMINGMMDEFRKEIRQMVQKEIAMAIESMKSEIQTTIKKTIHEIFTEPSENTSDKSDMETNKRPKSPSKTNKSPKRNRKIAPDEYEENMDDDDESLNESAMSTEAQGAEE